MEVLAVSDGVADLLGLGVVEVMGSQLTDMVIHVPSIQHPCKICIVNNLLQGLFRLTKDEAQMMPY